MTAFHSRYIFSKQMYNILIIAPNPAIFGAKAKKLVTEVGEPGIHLVTTYEKGTFERFLKS